MLFAFCVNDLESYLVEYNCNNLSLDYDYLNTYLKLLLVMYADDTILLHRYEDKIKDASVAFCNYCEDWKLRLTVADLKLLCLAKDRSVITIFLNLVEKTLR